MCYMLPLPATERGPVVSRQKYSEEYFRTVFEAAPTGVLAVDSSGRIAQLNAHAERLFGYSRAELIGKPIEVLVPPRFRDRHADLRKKSVGNRQIRPMGTGRTFYGLRKNGTEFPVEVGLNPAVMSSGQFVVATVVDITERNARGLKAWNVAIVAAFVLVFGMMIVAFLKPLTQIDPEKILGLGAEQPAHIVDAAYAAFEKGDYKSALLLGRPVADQGDSRAQSLLGLIYLNGRGVQRNDPEAMKWYRRAADQGDADAQVRIGDMYFEGRAVAQDYPDVQLEHGYVDSCAMALVTRPTAYDVIVTENLFGDILSDEAAVLTGSLGMLPSASIGGKVGLYEPVHGSAPDIAGKGIANPLGAIASAALLLRYTCKLETEAKVLETAISEILTEGYGTPDLKSQPKQVGTFEIGEAIRGKVVKAKAA